MSLRTLITSIAVTLFLTVPSAAQTEMVKNGTFSSGSTNWTLNRYGGSSSGGVINGEYRIVVTTAGTEHWHVQFIQTGIALVQGKTYTYGFDAYKGTQNSGTQSMQVNIGQSGSPYTSYFGSQNNMVTLTTTKTRYTYTITMTSPSDPNARLEFNCGKSTGSFYIDNVSLIENSNPLLSATPGSVDFGTVAVGTSPTVNVTLQNSGGAATTVSGLVSSSGTFTTGLSVPATVPASGSAVLPITFSPAGAGSYSGTVTIYSNASDHPTITLNLSGAATMPGIVVSSTALSFSAAPGEPVTQSVTLGNSGSSPITWSLTSNSAWATVTPASGSIDAGAQTECTVTALSATTGNYTGSLTLTHSATNQPSPIAIQMAFSVVNGYQPTCPLIVDPDQSIDFIRDLMAFRVRQRDNTNGGYFTSIDRQGNSTGANEKALCGQSRIAYAFVRAFMVTGEEQYLEYAHHALKFLYDHGWNNGWYFITDIAGNYVSHWGHNDWWSFQQHYALVGITAMVEATGGKMNWNDGSQNDLTWLMRGINSNYTKLWDANPSTKGYYNYANTAWTSKWGKGFHSTVDGITTHAMLMSMIFDSLNHKNRFVELADNVVDHLTGNMAVAAAGFPEMFNADWSIDYGNSNMDIGHGFKTAWVLQRAYLLNPDHPEYRDAGHALMQNLWDHGCYDEVNGAPFSYLNWQTGAVTGKNKDFWMVEQGFTSGLINYYTASTQEQRDRYMTIADGSLNFFLDHLIDPVYGESYNVVSTNGATVVDGNKGGLFTAGYHSTELGYYAYLYSSLYYHKTPVQLYYYYPAENNERSFKLTPLAIEDDVLKIIDVTLDGTPYTDFNSDTRTIRLPAGVGGKVKVTFGFTPAVTYTITASAASGGSIAPAGATIVNDGGTQTYTISPDAGYRIGDVLVDAVSVGTPASYTFTGVTADRTIAALFEPIPTHTITASASAGGSVSPSGITTLFEGEAQTITITPETGYRISDVAVDGVSVGVVTSYEFTDVTADHTITAVFEPIPTYSITASASAGGTISPEGYVTVTENGTQIFTISPATGYRIDDVLVDGTSVGTVASYEFSNVTANHTIAAVFVSIPTYTVSASASAGGTISPSGSVTVSEGASITFTITPQTGYAVSSLTVDGSAVAPAASYTFTNVTDDHSIAAGFTLKTYTITATAGAGGTISPSGTVTVQHGASQAFTIVPSTGYQIANVLIDGSSAGTVGSYTFTPVTAAHTISAQFSVISPTVYQINTGSNSTAAPFSGDQYGSGGTLRTVTNGITTAGVIDPAPQTVYQSERYGNSAYTIPNLTPGADYLVRLHFAELYQTATGRRVFNVAINGATVLSNFDIYAATGARYKATVREFTATANGSGQLTINFTTITDNATIEGIEIIQTAPNNPPTIVTAAAATPATVTASATSLSVLADDDNGEEELTYTWATTGTPPAVVTFSTNGTNAAKQTTATFSRAGSYSFQVTVRDQGNKSVISPVTVTVNQTLSAVTVSPASVTVNTSAAQQFSAVAADQFGVALSSQPAFAWSVSGGGSINGSGLFTAGADAGGPYIVTAQSGGIAGTANVTVSSLPVTVYQINCGSTGAVAPFTGDQYGTGGTLRTVTNTITLTGVTDPAPQNAYKSERYGNSTYTLPNLTAGNQYTVRLHFAELYQTAAGRRVFNVSINGATVIANFDIYSVTGARYKAVVREFTATANASGQIVINFSTITDNATIEGIEVLRQ